MADCPVCPTVEDGLPLWVNLVAAVVMVSLSALFSGLSLGLLSLDKKGLQILAEAGTPKERWQAAQIIPLRKDGNLLLCTLLLGNVLVNSTLSILLAGLTSGAVGLVASTTLIVIFGEIIPQSICSRHGLAIGALTRHVTWTFICLLYIIAKPISLCLDLFLGEEMGNMYSRDGLKRLLQMHAEEVDAEHEPTLTKEEQNLLAGAMEYSRKTVADVMTPLEKVFMLEANMKLTFDTMMQIYRSGYTRIPVFEGTPHIMGVLYVKDLILVDPDDEIEVQTVVTFRGPTQVRFILDTTPLHEVFKIFKASYTHLMIAVTLRSALTGQRIAATQLATAPQYVLLQAEKEVTGVITLEDVLEEVIKAEIVDEHDVFLSNEQEERIKPGRDRPDLSTFLSLFEHKIRDSTQLTRQEVQAAQAFLVARVRFFAPFANHKTVLRQLIRRAELVSIDEAPPNAASAATLEQDMHGASPGDKIGRHLVLYKRGEASSRFTLVLQGWVYVWAGSEAFETEVGPWAHLGSMALDASDGQPYIPDFSAATQGGACRLLQFERADVEKALQQCREAGFSLEVAGSQAADPPTPLNARSRHGPHSSPRSHRPNGSADMNGRTAPAPAPRSDAPAAAELALRPPPFSSLKHRLHTPNQSGVSPALVRPPQISGAFKDLLDAECAPAAAAAPAALLPSEQASEEEGDRLLGAALDEERPMIELTSVNARYGSLLDGASSTNPFTTGSLDLGGAAPAAEGALRRAPGSLSMADFNALVGSPDDAPRSLLQAGDDEAPAGSPRGKHSLDGVIVVGADGVPLCIEAGEPRAMPLLDVSEQQSVQNLATLRMHGLGHRNVRQMAGMDGGELLRSAADMTVVGGHTTLFMKSGHQGSPLERTPDGGKEAAAWFGSPPRHADELPLIARVSSSSVPGGSASMS